MSSSPSRSNDAAKIRVLLDYIERYGLCAAFGLMDGQDEKSVAPVVILALKSALSETQPNNEGYPGLGRIMRGEVAPPTDKPSGHIDVRGEICAIVSRMLDNPGECGIYPTTRCYDELEALVQRCCALSATDQAYQRCFDAAFKALQRLNATRPTWNGPIHQAAALLREVTEPKGDTTEGGKAT